MSKIKRGGNAAACARTPPLLVPIHRHRHRQRQPGTFSTSEAVAVYKAPRPYQTVVHMQSSPTSAPYENVSTLGILNADGSDNLSGEWGTSKDCSPS